MLTGVQGALGMLKKFHLKASSPFLKFIIAKRNNFLSGEYKNSYLWWSIVKL